MYQIIHLDFFHDLILGRGNQARIQPEQNCSNSSSTKSKKSLAILIFQNTVMIFKQNIYAVFYTYDKIDFTILNQLQKVMTTWQWF